MSGSIKIFCFAVLTSASLIPIIPVLSPAAEPTLASPSSAGICCVGNRTDDFSDGNLAPLWTDLSTCGSVAETGGQLVLTRPPGCDFLDGPEVRLDPGLIVCGDFDIQVDFNLINWPIPTVEHQASLFVVSGTEPFVIERVRAGSTNSCRPYLDAYKSWQTIRDNCSASWDSTADLQGKFRITRTGNSVQSYYWNGSIWVLLRTGTITTTLVAMGLSTSSTDGTAATVAFDNLIIQSLPPLDSDSDTVPNCVDNCPLAANPLQEDTDGDTIGDACDNCPNKPNSTQQDQDEDGALDWRTHDRIAKSSNGFRRRY